MRLVDAMLRVVERQRRQAKARAYRIERLRLARLAKASATAEIASLNGAASLDWQI